MSNFIIIVLLLVLIFKDVKFKKPERIHKEKIDEEEIKRQKEIREEFDKLMGYSIKDAIESKKVKYGE